jgi:hypothetical protein
LTTTCVAQADIITNDSTTHDATADLNLIQVLLIVKLNNAAYSKQCIYTTLTRQNSLAPFSQIRVNHQQYSAKPVSARPQRKKPGNHGASSGKGCIAVVQVLAVFVMQAVNLDISYMKCNL